MNRLSRLLGFWFFALALMAPVQAGVITYHWTFSQATDENDGQGTLSGTLSYVFHQGVTSTPITSFRLLEIPENYLAYFDIQMLPYGGLEMVREEAWSDEIEYYYGNGGVSVDPRNSELLGAVYWVAWALWTEDMELGVHSASIGGKSFVEVDHFYLGKPWKKSTAGFATFERLSPRVPEPSAMVIWGAVGVAGYRARRRVMQKKHGLDLNR